MPNDHEEEIRELANYFMNQLRYSSLQEECLMYAEMAIEGGYKFNKCFNKEHTNDNR